VNQEGVNCFMKKTEGQKSRDTVPLKMQFCKLSQRARTGPRGDCSLQGTFNAFHTDIKDDKEETPCTKKCFPFD
jgi:hypothetical protein